MKLAYNGIALIEPLTGIGQYAYQLGLRLQKTPAIDLQVFYGSHFEREARPRGLPAVGRFRAMVRRYVPNAYGIARWRRQRVFERGAGGCDLYHEPNFLAYDFDGPLVLTVHDLSWIRYPHTHPAERVRAMHKYFEPSLRRAQVVLTVSEFVKREVVEVFGLPTERIRVTPNGLDLAYRPLPAAQTRSVMASQRLVHGSYLLSVGTLEPRKNIQTTINAFASLPASLRKRVPLVIAGMKGWRTESIEKILAPLVESGEVRLLGYVDRETLAAITAGALAMVYPSLYEGFGLPPLEAMGCGVPAIVSNVSSLPEVVGDAGVLVSPLDVQALAEAMRALVEDPDLRQRLSRQSLERAAQFTWDRCAAETKAAYDTVLGESSR